MIRNLDGPLHVSEAECLARGMFIAAGRPPLENPDFAVVCLVSVLVFHDLTDENPYWVDVAVKRGDYRPRAAWPTASSSSTASARMSYSKPSTATAPGTGGWTNCCGRRASVARRR